MVLINGRYMKANDFGLRIAEKLCLGWNITIILTDEFWNGYMLFTHDNFVSVIVNFEKLNTFDEVTVKYNQLCKIEKEY